jgi:hypothetical protein
LIEILLVPYCGCGVLQYDEMFKIFGILADEECAYIYFVYGFCSGSDAVVAIVVVEYQ